MPVDPSAPLLFDHQAGPAPSVPPPPPSRGRPTRSLELDLWQQGCLSVAGVDEVGRGALAGPVVAGAVILRPRARPRWLADLRDSKQLSPRQRRRLAPQIMADVAGWAVGWASPAEIDRFNILRATRLAMQRALAALPAAPEFVLVDGNDRHDFDCPFRAIVGGDARVASIAAASVVAKVTRDAWMEVLSDRFRAYGFARNKGYGSPQHLRALDQSGPCAVHRLSFAPVRLAAGDAARALALPLGSPAAGA